MASLESSNTDWVARQLMNVCSQLCEQATISHPDFNEEGMMREGSEVRRATVDILHEFLHWCRPYKDGASVVLTQLSPTTWYLGLLYYGTRTDFDNMMIRAAQLGMERINLRTGGLEDLTRAGDWIWFHSEEGHGIEDDPEPEKRAWYSF